MKKGQLETVRKMTTKIKNTDRKRLEGTIKEYRMELARIQDDPEDQEDNQDSLPSLEEWDDTLPLDL